MVSITIKNNAITRIGFFGSIASLNNTKYEARSKIRSEKTRNDRFEATVSMFVIAKLDLVAKLISSDRMPKK
jgi:hypothetical protein